MKKKWSFLLCFVLLLFNTINAHCKTKSEGVTKPNIIVVLIDDMGWNDFSCFGNTSASTPYIDQIANEGIRFNNFYVNAPICSPSRVAITTGQYPQRHRITSYLAQRVQNLERGMENWLNPEAPTLARYLNSDGYATGHFGKWHMGGQRDVGDAPAITEYGFEESVTNFEGMGPKLLPIVRFPNPDEPGDTIETHIWDEKRLGGPITYMMRCEITGGYIDHALNFIDNAKNQGKPFYVNIWPDDVHTPMYPSIDRWSDNKRDRYHAVLEEMDEQLEVLFEKIKNDPDLKDNTLVFILSDNGPENGCGSAGIYKGFKGHLYEGGIKSPLIVWGPGLINSDMVGKVNNSTVLASIDLLPSVLSISGINLPEEVELDGQDMSSQFTGQTVDERNKPVFFRRPPDRPTADLYGNLPDLAMRSGKWKLLCDIGGENPQLYNLDDDPSEANNLYLEEKDLTDQMILELLQWNSTMPGDAGVPNQNYLENEIKSDSIVFYYPFDGIADDASHNNIKLVQDLGEQPSFEDGQFGQSIRLKNMRFLTENDSVFNPYYSHTLAGWVKLTSYTNTNQVIVHQINDPKNQVGRVHLEVFGSGSYISSFTGGDTKGNHRTIANESTELDRWYHVASVFDREGGTKYLYVDGELVSYVAINSQEKCYGKYVFGANKAKNSFFDGCLDELVLIKQALNEDAVNYLMSDGLGSVVTDIETNSSKLDFKIVPNPSDGKFKIMFDNLKGEVNYQITDLNGSLVKSGKADKYSVINLGDCPRGLYLVTLDLNGTKSSQKLLIK